MTAAGPQVPGDVAAMAAEVKPAASQNVPISAELVQIAERRYRFAADLNGNTFAVEHDGPNLAHPLRGSHGLRQQLSAEYYDSRGRAPSSNALTDAVSVIEGRAQNAARERIELRVAEHADGVVLDLGTPDGRCVIATPAGWQIADRSPVVFRRTELTNPLPDPVHGGDIDALRDVLNVTAGSWQALVGWLIAAMIPNLPHPILLLTGEQGTGKTTAARMIADLIDPSGAPLIAPPRGDDRWIEAAHGSWVIGIDNLSSIPGWLSDALCRASTGEAMRKRTLYSDTGTTVVRFRRCVLLTGIGITAARGDLAERLLTVELDRIGSDRRRPEADLTHRYRAAHPQVLGGLLDLLVQVLAVRDTLTLEHLPRMADYARVLAALDHVTGWDTLPNYLQAGSDMAAELAANDPVGAAVIKLIEHGGDWQGTATELLAALNTLRGDTRPPAGWPTSPSQLSTRVKRAATGLLDLGIDATHGRTGRARLWTVRRVNNSREQPSSPSSPSQPAPMLAFSGDSTGDGSDAGDGTMTAPAGEPSPLDPLSMQAQTAIEHPDDGSDGDLRAVLSTPVECADCGDLVDAPDLTGSYCHRCAF